MTDSTREAIMSTLLARVQSAVTKTFIGDTTLGSAIITSPSPVSGLFVGLPVFGAGLANGAVIDSIDTTARTITLDQPATATASSVSFSTGFQTVGRRVLFWSKVAAQPALFLRNTGDNYVRQGILELRTMHVEVWIYSRAGMNPEIAPSIGLNNLVDAVEGAFAPDDSAFNTLTLGGLVQHCWIEGDSSFDPGDVDGQAKAIIPVRILFPPCLCGAGVSGATIGPAPYTGPLDIASGAIVAYGQRALSAARRGSALYTIRRDSDNTTESFSSGVVSGTAPTSAVSSFIGGGSGFVTVWNDQSAHANHAVQATAAKQPGFLADAGNGLPGFRVDSTVPQGLATTSPVSVTAGQLTAFIVFKYGPPFTADGATKAWFGINGSDLSYGLWTFDQGNVNFYASAGPVPAGPYWYSDTTVVGGGSADAGNINVTDIRGADSGGAVDFQFNNATVNSNDVSVTNGPLPAGDVSGIMAIGDDTAALTDIPFDGTMIELLIYQGNMDPTLRLQIRQNIAAYYGITLS